MSFLKKGNSFKSGYEKDFLRSCILPTLCIFQLWTPAEAIAAVWIKKNVIEGS